MRKWFRYRSGFINIDDEYIYFTDTGNWSEAGNLSVINLNNEAKNRRKNVFFTLLLALDMFLPFVLGDFYALWIIFPIVLFALIYDLKSNNLTSTNKVKLVDIENINIDGLSVQIRFLISEHVSRVRKLRKVEDKGLIILESITQRMFTNLDYAR